MTYNVEDLPGTMPQHVQVAESGCWEWTGCRDTGNYGSRWNPQDKKMRKAHREAYLSLVGTIPEGLDLDHLCRNRPCCNPEHLEPVTRSENIRRGDGPKILQERQGAKTHCKKGHPYSGDNLYLNPRGQRECMECRRIARTASYRRVKSKVE